MLVKMHIFKNQLDCGLEKRFQLKEHIFVYG